MNQAGTRRTVGSALARVFAVWRADTAGRPAIGAAVRVLRAVSAGMQQ